MGFLSRRCSGPHLLMMGEPLALSRVAVGFSNYNGEIMEPLMLPQGSAIFHLSCEGELGITLESLQGK